MFINEVPNNAELSAIIVNELRDLYGIKYRKEKKLKTHQVSRIYSLNFNIGLKSFKKSNLCSKNDKKSEHKTLLFDVR